MRSQGCMLKLHTFPPGKHGPPLNTKFLWPAGVHIPNGIWSGLEVLAQLMVTFNRCTHTDTHTSHRAVLQLLTVALMLSRLDWQYCAFRSATTACRQASAGSECHARLVLASRRRDHISPRHWLRVAECIAFWFAVPTYSCLHGSAPEYLLRQLQRVSDVHTRQRVTSVYVIYCTCHFADCSSHHQWLGAFSTAVTSVWNSLPEAVHSLASQACFESHNCLHDP